MVEFWSDHFNIDQTKGRCLWLKTIDDRELRKHALGNFRDLVWASAHSPAMLFYVDNAENRKCDAESGSKPNENYARELLELHTLGVDGGYTLGDIQEVARCLTGWSISKGLTLRPDEFAFNELHHDEGEKIVLGSTVVGGQSMGDGEAVIDLICRHPSTARFVAKKLCRRFVADRGPDELVAEIAEVFLRTDGDITKILTALFHSPHFLMGNHSKVKRPFDYVASTLRALNASTTGLGALDHLQGMGHAPFRWPLPDGYPDHAEAWTPTLLGRWNFAAALVSGNIHDARIDEQALQAATGASREEDVLQGLARSILGQELVPAQLQAMLQGTKDCGRRDRWQQRMALLVSLPRFQMR